jgi:DNA polymerase-4
LVLERQTKGHLDIPQESSTCFFKSAFDQKNPMVGDVTFQTLSRIGIRTIQTLSEMPAEVLQRMIGKMELRFGKKPMASTTIL